MKNLMYLFLVIALAIGLTSCEKEEVLLEEEVQKENLINPIDELSDTELDKKIEESGFITDDDILEETVDTVYLSPANLEELESKMKEHEELGLEFNLSKEVQKYKNTEARAGWTYLVRNQKVYLKRLRFYKYVKNKNSMNGTYYITITGEKNGVYASGRGAKTYNENQGLGSRRIRSSWTPSTYTWSYMRKSDLFSNEIRGVLIITPTHSDQNVHVSVLQHI